jgi:YlmC/YmxH family sporulation protein
MDLRNKEVVNINNGEKLGFVDDVEIDTDTSSVLALVIYGRERIWGIFGRDDDLIISCKDIKVVGKDTILVAYKGESEVSREKQPKSKFFDIENLYR